ncbi:hypothetical protein Sjap_000831 [Stephania japonica]|uniref:RING-type E3 ubiquitin transferase n=1 Tax=Stephania japonica TaxID=461633 RepID=A0AAP0KIV2_9MAGN
MGCIYFDILRILDDMYRIYICTHRLVCNGGVDRDGDRDRGENSKGKELILCMAHTKRIEDVRKAEEARKTEEVKKKTIEKAELVGKIAQTASYKKSKELGKGKRDSNLHDEASTTQREGGEVAGGGRAIKKRRSRRRRRHQLGGKKKEKKGGGSKAVEQNREEEDEKNEVPPPQITFAGKKKSKSKTSSSDKRLFSASNFDAFDQDEQDEHIHLTSNYDSGCVKALFKVAPPEAGNVGHGNEDDVKCSICQEEYANGEEVGKLQCDHWYHAACVYQWLWLKN